MYAKEEVHQLLDEKGISYEWVEHEAAYTIEDMVRMGLDSNADVAKNLFLRDQKGKNHFLVVIRADKKVDLKVFGETLGVGKLSFASEERLMKYLGLTKGAVTPLGVLNDEERNVKVFFDRDFLGMEKIGVHPNVNTASVYLGVNDLLDLLKEHGNSVVVTDFAS